MTATARRPLGIAILAVLGIISGLVTILLALPSLGISGFLMTPQGQAEAAYISSDLRVALALFGAGFLILGVLNLAFGIGAIALRKWAWPLGAGLQGLNLLFNVVDWIEHGFGVVGLLNVVIAVAILWYLLQPNIRAAFGR